MFESIHPAGPNWKLRIVLGIIVLILMWGSVSIWRMTQMPLRSYRGPLPPLTREQAELSQRLSSDVGHLCEGIGERSLDREDSLALAASYLRSELREAGYEVVDHPYKVGGEEVSNLEVTLKGSDEGSGVVVVGAHYDTAVGVGANDNASGVAAVVELARLLRSSKLRRTVRLVLFANEEPPYFQTANMGSLVYAKELRHDHVAVSAMISLETIGFYSDEPGSQQYPAVLGWFYPNRGNFIGFVANPESRDLLHRAIRRFRETTQFPSEGVSAPENLQGVGWSDQWSFWQQGYPAVMITDTAPFRYRYYHTARDTAEKIDFDKMARVVEGVRKVVESLANEP